MNEGSHDSIAYTCMHSECGSCGAAGWLLCTCVSMSILGMNDDAIRSLVWNLRTWPLELVQWETQNSHRLDIQFNPEPDR